ncbi:phosphotransferase [Nocardioides dongxiaopingii]|uniref:phosphotransferase enzyme family protein n=1 Tax=Nocardioides sp. S-1144 TaxID=2582905 RepID=UPI00110D5E37|nr:phosphotransferase [Nocardioides sp. S-1144]QCW50753.1 phosphotransferase [Nocardioides sp. S-1144]
MGDVAVPVELLWEDGDPHAALRTRFGFADAVAAAAWVAAVVEAEWGLEVGSVDRVVISDSNALAWLATPAGPVLAKWSAAPDRFAHLDAVARLTGWLARRGLPVSAPLRSLGGVPQVRVAGVSMNLQRVVPGDLLDVGRPEQVRAAGAVLARLHGALAAYPRATWSDSPTPEVAAPAARIATWLGATDDGVLTPAREALRGLAARAPDDGLPVQLVHGDVRAANILCEGESATVTALLDLEEARVDHAVVELARSAVLLGTRFRGWAPVSSDVRAGFLAGYESVRPLSPVEAAWWDALVLWQALAAVPAGDDPAGWGASALDHVGPRGTAG